MAVIVKERDRKTRTLEKMVFEDDKQEDFLQADIAASPEIIPLHELEVMSNVVEIGERCLGVVMLL